MQKNLLSAKSCRSCVKAKSLIINDDYICLKHGVVDEDYVCSRFEYNPHISTKCNSCNYFSISAGNTPDLGYCSLFSRRTFDGCQRQSCKLYSPKSKLYTESTG